MGTSILEMDDLSKTWNFTPLLSLSKYYNYNPDPEYEYSPKHSSSKRNSAEALANYQVQQAGIEFAIELWH